MSLPRSTYKEVLQPIGNHNAVKVVHPPSDSAVAATEKVPSEVKPSGDELKPHVNNKFPLLSAFSSEIMKLVNLMNENDPNEGLIIEFFTPAVC